MKNNELEQNNPQTVSDPPLLDQLSEVDEELWEHMKFDFELVEEPAELKDEVLNFVFKEDLHKETPWEHVKLFFQTIRNQFTPLTTGLTAALLAAIVLLSIPEMGTPVEDGFSEITASMKLIREDSVQNDAYGHAFLLKTHGKEELVVNVFGFPQTKGQEVYQVWLIQDGKRQSAGIFKPDSDGTGVLTVDMSKLKSFEKIGITLEPDAGSSQPKGTKIVGT